MKHLSFLTFSLLLLSSPCLAEILFFTPSCFPHCARSDMQALLSEGEREGLILDAIASAQKTIAFSMYTFSRKPIFNALINAAKQNNIEILGIMDHNQFRNIKNFCHSYQKCKFNELFDSITYLQADLDQRLLMAGKNPLYQKATLTEKLFLLFYKSKYKVIIKNAPGRDRYIHNKFLLIDDHTLIAGSGNWSSTAMSVNLENIEHLTLKQTTTSTISSIGNDLLREANPLSIFSSGLTAVKSNKATQQSKNRIMRQAPPPPSNQWLIPLLASTSNQLVLQSFHCAFKLMWSDDGNKIYNELRNCEIPQIVYFTPAPESRPSIFQEIAKAIDNSSTSIDISMHHLTHPTLLEKIYQAAQRGVSVRLLFDNDDCMNRTKMAVVKKLLTSSNISIRFAPTNCQLFQLSHNKYGIFDNKTAINGSGNWSNAGLHKNYEFYLVYNIINEVNKFHENFEYTWQKSHSSHNCGCNPSKPHCRALFCFDSALLNTACAL